MSLDLYQSLDLYEEKDYIYVTRHHDGYPNEIECIEINKTTKEIRLIKTKRDVLKPPSGRIIYGILGFLKLPKSFCAIVVIERRLIGRILNHEIFAADKIEIISCDKQSYKTIAKHDGEYLNMISQHFTTGGFYFSYTYDLTRFLEKNLESDQGCVYSSLVEFNAKYTWNHHLLKRILHVKDIFRYFLPIICGYIGHYSHSGDVDFTIFLISRRSNERVGTRYFVRGSDSNGYVVNYVETEMILTTSKDAFSYVQVRGSIPLAWTQYPNLKYKPKMHISSTANQINIIKNHFERELEERRREIIINLVDNKGDEGNLSEYFAHTLSKIGFHSHKLSYFYFDFHNMCKKMRFDRVSILLDELEDIRSKMGYFRISLDQNSSQVVNRQFGVFRTNCIDCLDRTNVVQSSIAWRTLLDMAYDCQILTKDNKNITYQKMEFMHKQLWADNADYLSIQYTGSPALKTDFTRYGVRTFKGMLNDLIYSIKRYIYCNFYDGVRQDSLDLISGHFDFDTQRPDTYVTVKSTSTAILPILFLSILLLFIGTVFLLSNSKKSRMFLGILQIVAMAYIVKYMLRNPEKYIDLPRLIALENREKFK